MAGIRDPVGVKNTVRLEVEVSDTRRNRIEYVGKEVVEKLAGIHLSKVFCLQESKKQGIYDVTFFEEADCLLFARCLEVNARNSVLDNISFRPLFRMRETALFVHVYNPYTDLLLIKHFLRRYCESVKGGERQTSVLGIFNGTYKFWVKFRPDESCAGGMRYPPANFSVGGERGYLYFTGMLQFCRRCQQYGHLQDQCNMDTVCRNCMAPGHNAGSCPSRRKCDFCGSVDHAARACPEMKIQREEERRQREEADERAREKKERREEEMKRKQEEARLFLLERERQEKERMDAVAGEEAPVQAGQVTADEAVGEEMEEEKIEEASSPESGNSQEIGDWSSESEEKGEEDGFFRVSRGAKKFKAEEMVPRSVEEKNRYKPLSQNEMDISSGSEASPGPLNRKSL